MKPDRYIALSACEHGYLYRIHARNFHLGVFDQPALGFIGIREKFGAEYLFTEYHYDTGAPFGTVFPHEKLEPCPVSSLTEDSPELFAWLAERQRYYRSQREPT